MSFTLLTLPNVSLLTTTTAENGTLAIECLSDPHIPSDNAPGANWDSGITLAFHLNTSAVVLERGSLVSLLIAPSGQRSYSFQGLVGDGPDKKALLARVTIPPPKTSGGFITRDVETFDSLLAQYAKLSWSYGDPADLPKLKAPPPLPPRSRHGSPPQIHPNIMANVEEARPVADPSLRGRLVLMDDANGEVVGELPQSLNVTEDPALAGKSNAPVVLELDPDTYDACTGARELGAEGEELSEIREVFARAIPPEEQDWLLKGATFVSQAISGSTSLLLSGITSVSNFYIAHSTPGTPATFSRPGSGSASPITPGSPPSPASPSATTSTMERVYALSGTVANTSSRAAGAVENVIRRAVGAEPKTNSGRTTSPAVSPRPSAEVLHTPPPAYAVYTPKQRPLPSRTSSEKEKHKGDEKEREDAAEDQEQERKPLGTKDRLLLSANLVLTTVDDSARRMFEVGSDRLGAVVGHKFGPDAQRSTHLATHTARNIVLVYVDVRGFARRALITKTGKEFVKARFGGKKAPQADVDADAKDGASASGPPSGAATPNLAAASLSRTSSSARFSEKTA
ncbi:hypothetical protein EIP86_010934 [Pleurotus ostreatoroseus]|nr:hypothetical protein EIP86_010934 [Pleurotus ostreatoroseus]